MCRNPLFILVLATIGCAVDDGVEAEFRSDKYDPVMDSGGCIDDTVVVPGTETKRYAVKSTTEIALADGVVAVEDESGVVFLDDGLSGFQCRCPSGCSEREACTTTLEPLTMTCSGWCDGISSDNGPCVHCEWHTVEIPSGPSAGAPGALDPGVGGPTKPPGADPGPGAVDPTW